MMKLTEWKRSEVRKVISQMSSSDAVFFEAMNGMTPILLQRILSHMLTCGLEFTWSEEWKETQ